MSVLTLDEVLDALEIAYGSAHQLVEVDRDNGTFSLRSPGVAATDLSSLVTTLTGTDTYIPDWMPSSLRLEELVVTRTSDESGFAAAGVVLSSHGFPFSMGEHLSIDRAEIEFEYRFGHFTATIRGDARLTDLDVDLRVEAEVPAQIYSLRLAAPEDGDPTADPTASLYERMGVPHHGSGTPILRDFSITGSLVFGRYSGYLVIDDILHLDAIEIGRVHAAVELGAEPTAEIGCVAAITLGETRIEFDVEGFASRRGWRLLGEIGLEHSPTVDDLVAMLATKHDVEAPSLPTIIGAAGLKSLLVEVNTIDESQHFSCEVEWTESDAILTLDVRHEPGHLTVTGSLHVHDLVFDVHFDRDASSSTITGVYSSAGGTSVTLQELLVALGGDLADIDIPLTVDLHDAVFARHSINDKEQGASQSLVAVDLGLGVDLAALHGLPLVGSMLPAEASLKLALEATMSSAWTADDLTRVRPSLPNAMQLPATLTKGPHIAARVELGGQPIGDVIEVEARPGNGEVNSSPSRSVTNEGPAAKAAAALPADDYTWHELGAGFGPIHLDRVGLAWQSDASEVAIALDGRLSVLGLTLSLDGLAAHYGLTSHHLDVSLRGLGLDFKQGSIEIGGAFLNVDGDFAGKVVIGAEALKLSALGAFSMNNGQPSMFLYGVLDYPLGGPAFFFVEGLAAGFGFNRKIVMPPVREVRTFPLVADAAGETVDGDLSTQLARLHDYVAPALGEYFLAAGVKFTSFKLLESFALLVVRFGETNEIDILGTSTYQTPPGDLGGVPAMAHVELNLVGRIPLDGSFIKVAAQLTNRSYVYASLCKLSGGFAFSSWFAGEHAGDFVLSVGGYSPDFHPEVHKPHYPVVPRLSLTYQVSDDIYVKGWGYFALTPSLFMAGAGLEAVAKIGAVSATFRLAIHFEIGWEPYHYKAGLSVYIGAKWKCFSTHASARLSIHGPEFGGHAHVEWTVFSFDVDFGKSHDPGPAAIDFARFEQKFLPHPDKTVSIRLESGLVTTHGEGANERWVVNAKELVISTSCPLPAKTGGLEPFEELGSLGDAETDPVEFGVAPMNHTSIDSATHMVRIEREVVHDTGTEFVAVSPDDFHMNEVTSSFPGALWGESMRRRPTDPMISAIAGYQVRPSKRHSPGEYAQPLNRGDLQYEAAAKPVDVPTPSPQRVLHRVPIDRASQPVPQPNPILASLGIPDDAVVVDSAFEARNALAHVRVQQVLAR